MVAAALFELFGGRKSRTVLCAAGLRCSPHSFSSGNSAPPSVIDVEGSDHDTGVPAGNHRPSGLAKGIHSCVDSGISCLIFGAARAVDAMTDLFDSGKLFAAMVIASSVVLAAYGNRGTSIVAAVALVFACLRDPILDDYKLSFMLRCGLVIAVLAVDFFHNHSVHTPPLAFAVLYA